MTVKLDDILASFEVRRTDGTKVTLCVINIVGDASHVFLKVDCTSEDNYKPGELFTVERGQVVDYEYPDAPSALRVVRSVLHYVACHEADEAMFYKGSRPFDPHSDLVPSDLP